MSLLQQYQLQAEFEEQSGGPDVDPLRMELGWKDVGSGLSKILIGYGVVFACVVASVCMVVYVAVSVGEVMEQGGGGGKPDIGLLWVVYLGNAVISLGMLYGYICILTGKFRCAIHAPERSGARWLIFGCMIAVVCGPVIGFAMNFSTVSHLSNNPDRYMQELVEKHNTMRISISDLVGPAVSLMTTVLFVLFLRAIGSCFNNSMLVTLVDVYLTFSAVLIGISLFLMFNLQMLKTAPLIFVLALAGWGVSLASYVALLIFSRIVIVTGLAGMKSPLETAT